MSGSITIRPYEPSDNSRCRALWAETTERHREIYDDPTIGGDDPGLEFDEHLNKVGAGRIWVATIGSETVGLTSLILDGPQAEIEPVIVSVEHRGQGIGRVLVDHAIEQAKQEDVLCVYVKPVARNEEAISFFYDCGFRTLGHVQMFQWLGPSVPSQWKPGPKLFGKEFEY